MDSLHDDLEGLLNRYSRENRSDTPDFILAGYLLACLSAYEEAVQARKRWHNPEPGLADKMVSLGMIKEIGEEPPDDAEREMLEEMEKRKVAESTLSRLREDLILCRAAIVEMRRAIESTDYDANMPEVPNNDDINRWDTALNRARDALAVHPPQQGEIDEPKEAVNG